MIGKIAKIRLSKFPFAVTILLLTALISFYATPVRSQQQSDFEKAKAAAYRAFAEGRVRTAADLLKKLISKAPTKDDEANLERDLIEICATGYLPCYYEANQALFALIQAEKPLARLYPELMLYVFRERIWADDKAFIQKTIDNGGAAQFAQPEMFPATYAEMQLTLHRYYIEKGDLKAAEELTSSAIMGLLLSDHRFTYATCKILVELLSALLEEQDIVGAFQFLDVVDPYVSKNLSHESALYARYLIEVATLYGYTNLHDHTVKTFGNASRLYEKLEILPDIAAFNLSLINSSTSAILAIQDKLGEAEKLHANHPMQKAREEIIKRGVFQNLQEFYFAISDVFLNALAKKPVDLRWKALFEKKTTWGLSGSTLIVMDAYRSFALGCIELSKNDRPKATVLFIDAAKKRLDAFQNYQRVNFEGFQLANWIDKIVVGVAFKFAADAGSPEAADIMLRGGDVLQRNLRHLISDEAILLASQPNANSRRNAHAFMNLVRDKRRWELATIKRWLENPAQLNRGALIQEYTSTVTTLEKLKRQFLNGTNFVQANGLPTVEEIKKTLSEREVFISYFPMFTGFGRLCVSKDDAIYSFGQFDQSAQNHIRLLEFATTANYAPNDKLDSQFPVDSAIYLHKIMFDGLDKCMKPGSNVTIAMPTELAGVPVAALLRDRPPPAGDGYDLSQAQWLVKQFSFSFVVSARQFVAVRTRMESEPAPLDYLGVGAPELNKKNVAELDAAFSFRGSGAVAMRDLNELPETARELRTVAKDFDPSRQRILVGDMATEESFRSDALNDFDVIHFATHGVFSQNEKGSAESSLILTPVTPTDSFNDGVLSASEISRFSLRARLIVLSACNSAKYDQRQANLGVHDFQSAFTVAGAPTVLAALWSIDSATSAHLMTLFFERWRDGQHEGAAQALAETVRSFLHKADTAHQHPRFWAAFEIFGDGGISGIRRKSVGQDVGVLKRLPGFSTGGEIISGTQLGSDLIFSMIGEWDGTRMAGIISRRDLTGKEKWRVTSREIGAAGVLTSGEQIYALGYKGVDHFTPLIQAFDSKGQLLWKREFADLLDQSFTSATAVDSGVIVFSYPRFLKQDQSKHPGYLLRIDATGKEIQRVPVRIEGFPNTVNGVEAHIRKVNDRIIVAINNDYSTRFNPKRKSVLGMASVCYEGASVTVQEFSERDLKLLKTSTIKNFLAGAIRSWSGSVVIGGQALDNCQYRGVAAVMKEQPGKGLTMLWKDDSVFISSVRGMDTREGLHVAVNYERPVAINVSKPVNVDRYVYDKRYGDDDMSIREASLIAISPRGDILSRKDLSAGLSVFLTGANIVGGKLIGYGSLGGEPAATLH